MVLRNPELHARNDDDDECNATQNYAVRIKLAKMLQNLLII